MKYQTIHCEETTGKLLKEKITETKSGGLIFGHPLQEMQEIFAKDTGSLLKLYNRIKLYI